MIAQNAHPAVENGLKEERKLWANKTIRMF